MRKWRSGLVAAEALGLAGFLASNRLWPGAAPDQSRAASRCARSRLRWGSISAISASDSTPPMAAIRQVGPNKQGANGSYTVYRVAE